MLAKREARGAGLLTSTIFSVVIFVWMTGMAIRQIRENRRRGIKYDWPRALAAAGGSIAVALAGIGVLLAGLTTDHAAAGGIGCAAVMIGGMIALALWIKRRWPTRTSP